MEINKNCTCPHIDCPRYGKCDECRAFHRAKGEKTMCEKQKEETKPQD